jgi:hypothetical protein
MPITSSAILGQHSFMFECGIGEFALERYPRRANEALQAWDAADKLILRKLEDHCGFSGSFTQGFSQSFTHPRCSVAFF